MSAETPGEAGVTPGQAPCEADEALPPPRWRDADGVEVLAVRLTPANLNALWQRLESKPHYDADLNVDGLSVHNDNGREVALFGEWIVMDPDDGLPWTASDAEFHARFKPYDARAHAAVTPGQAAYEARHIAKGRRMGADDATPDSEILAVIALGWDELPPGVQADEEAGARAAIRAGGWDALAAEIESLAPGDGISVASTILAQVCRAVTARLTGSRPQGEVSVWIDDEGDGDAKVTVAWGKPRQAEKAVRGE